MISLSLVLARLRVSEIQGNMRREADELVEPELSGECERHRELDNLGLTPTWLRLTMKDVSEVQSESLGSAV